MASSPVVFDQIPADLRLTGTGVSGEQGEPFWMMAMRPLRLQFGQTVEQEQHLPVALAGEAGTEATSGPLLMFCLHRCGLPLPVNPEGRVGNTVIELIAVEFVVVQGVTELHIVGSPPRISISALAMPKVNGFNSWPKQVTSASASSCFSRSSCR